MLSVSDLRECEINNGGCDQICTDFLGGYSCSWRDGFYPLTANGSICEGYYTIAEVNIKGIMPEYLYRIFSIFLGISGLISQMWAYNK